jgi:hypothetical protein
MQISMILKYITINNVVHWKKWKYSNEVQVKQ